MRSDSARMPGVVNRSTRTCQDAGGQSHLLDQFALRGQQIAFTVDVEQPGRRLDQPVPDGMAILPHERDPRLIVERDDARRHPGGERYSRVITSPSGACT